MEAGGMRLVKAFKTQEKKIWKYRKSTKFIFGQSHFETGYKLGKQLQEHDQGRTMACTKALDVNPQIGREAYSLHCLQMTTPKCGINTRLTC